MYEWDTNKEKANVARHGINFSFVENFDWTTAIECLDTRIDYDEERWIAIGFIGIRLHVLVYKPVGDNIRVISLRKATKRETKNYETQTQGY